MGAGQSKKKKKELEKIHSVLNEVCQHTVKESSSRQMIVKLLSGKYDDKLVYSDNTENKNNYITVTKLPNQIWNISVVVDTNKYKKAPTDQVKRIDWIYEHMDKIYICL